MTIKSILIDAAHREETRIAVLEDGILQDFDREALAIKQIKGNIYLARVTRVEASLQAAFVDYGSDKHGFLPFSDIHPDFYEIPETERQKLRDINSGPSDDDDSSTPNRDTNHKKDEDNDSVVTGSYSIEDETENYRGNIHNIYRRYNIQDVIKPGQLVLVQGSKEERGNKGASMTTYISIAGKYSVLMANTPNKGGVSKKVDNFRDRKLLKSILNDLDVPADRSVIIRTAGVGKKPEEIKRDCDYLSRLWGSVKESAESSTAPAFIHAEDDVIKRCIRDVYNEQISEVVIEGEDAFKAISSFVKLTTPQSSHNVKLYSERVPIFNKYRVEQQISALYEKQINLPSGGSIVIDHTEALVAVDVNSGRSTKESGVEDMAFKTNFEAVKEIAKQLRLRDLAGLVVIDFIDMYDQKNRRNVERAMRDELQNDRARIQLGRISIFGLLEMSRQRLGSSFFETITEPCKHCSGTGYVRSVEILAVSILRAIRHACADKQAGVIYIYTDAKTIAYLMNFKKNDISSTEKSYNINIFMHPTDEAGSQGFSIKKRKSLSDNERQEIEMPVTTGKVNQLGLEKSYLESYSNNDEPYEGPTRQSGNKPRNNKSKKSYNGRRDKGKSNSRNKAKKSFLKSVFSVFSK